MLPEKQAAVLADYRSKKLKSAAALAKAHGVSRSAVYRLLQAAATSPLAEEPRVAEAPKPEPVKLVITEYDSDDELQFLRRSDKFAEDLGLPAAGSTHQVVNDGKAPAEREEELDEAVEAIFSPPRHRVFIPEQEPEPRFVRPVVPIVSVDRQDLVQRIIFNVQTFGPLLTTIIGPSSDAFIATLQNLTDDELAGTLKTLERTRSVGNIAAGFSQTFYMVAQATEMTTEALGVKAQGFTARLRAEEQQISMIMKELAIDNWERVKAMDSPTARLGILFCMTLAQTDATNRLAAASGSARMSPGTEAAHADL